MRMKTKTGKKTKTQTKTKTKMRINGGGWLEGLFLEVWDRSRGLNLIEIWGRKIWEKARQDLRPVIAQLGPGEKWLWSVFLHMSRRKTYFGSLFTDVMHTKCCWSFLCHYWWRWWHLILGWSWRRQGKGLEDDRFLDLSGRPPPTKTDQPPLTFPPRFFFFTNTACFCQYFSCAKTFRTKCASTLLATKARTCLLCHIKKVHHYLPRHIKWVIFAPVGCGINDNVHKILNCLD